MLDIKQALSSDQTLKALTGLNLDDFEQLLPIFERVYQQQHAEAKPQRQRAVGGGRRHTLQGTAEQLFFILFYRHCYPTMAVASFFFGVDRSRIQRWIKGLLPVLEASLGQELVLPKRQINSVEALWQQFPQIKDLFSAGTEHPGQQPQDGKSQLQPYSEREKRSARQNLIVSEDQNQIGRLTRSGPAQRLIIFASNSSAEAR